MKRFPTVTILLFLAVASGPALASSHLLSIAQLDANGEFGCVLDPAGNRITVKRAFGRNEILTIHQAWYEVTHDGSRRGNEKAYLRAVFRDCGRGDLPPPAPENRSFAFYCEQGFHLPAVADEGNRCGVDLSSLDDGSKDYDAVIGILDYTLGAECEDDGGTFYTPAILAGYHPLYYGACLLDGEEPDGQNTAASLLPPTLGMEEEAADCFSAGPSGYCDDVEPTPPKGTGGGTTTTPKPKPKPEEDCLVMRMEEEAADC